MRDDASNAMTPCGPGVGPAVSRNAQPFAPSSQVSRSAARPRRPPYNTRTRRAASYVRIAALRDFGTRALAGTRHVHALPFHPHVAADAESPTVSPPNAMTSWRSLSNAIACPERDTDPHPACAACAVRTVARHPTARNPALSLQRLRSGIARLRKRIRELRRQREKSKAYGVRRVDGGLSRREARKTALARGIARR